MTASPGAAQPRPSALDAIAVYLKPRVLIVMFLGFSSGLPLALSGATLLVWMRESGVDLGTIGLFALVGTPYTVKFLWAPLTDALDVPVLRTLARPPPRLAGVHANPADRRDRVPRLDRSGARAGAGRIRRAAGRDRFGHAGHRGRRLPRRKPAGERAGRGHGLLRRGLSHRHAGLDRRRAVPGQRHPGLRLRQAGLLALGLCGDGGSGADRHCDGSSRHRAGTLARGRGRRTRSKSRSRASPRRRSALSRIFSATRWRS